MRIWRVDGASPYVAAPGCSLAIASRVLIDADCQRPTRLTRLELFMRGWSVSLDGRPAALATTGEIFQAVDLPAGRTQVRFAFAPPSLDLARALAVAGLAVLAIGVVAAALGRGLNSSRERAT